MTKKFFIAADPGSGTQRSDFIAPVRQAGQLVFVSIRTGKPVSQFMTVYTGVELTRHTVFSRMVDAGLSIESVDQTLDDLEAVLKQSRDAKPGHVYEPEPGGEEFDFKCLGKQGTT